MSAPQYSAADYLAALQALLPRGRAWPRDGDANLTKVVTGLVQVFARNNVAAADLIVDAFPLTTLQLLPQWEATLGLPDPCAGVSPTIQARRAQVVAKFTGIGGQSAPYMIAYAKSLGYVITITQYVPARIGQSAAGQPLYGVAWAHAWRVNSALSTVNKARIGVATAGEPLASWSNTVLQCELQEIAPAHTVLIFSYS
jgi:uncharacterized protein YmfQ (DUF2313 family)